MMIDIDKLLAELNPEQKKAANMPIASFTKIVAGAGTGKTKTITKRYVKLINDLISQDIENPIERLLVITFTEKAAGEMKERIFKELKNNNIKYYDQDNYISTIHGFCSKILKRFSIEANLSPNFSVAEKSELENIYNDIIQKIKYGEYNNIEYIFDVKEKLGLENIDNILSAESLLKLTKINSLNTVFDNIFPIIQQIKSMGITPSEFLNKTLHGIDEYSKIVKKLEVNSSFDKETYYAHWENTLKNYFGSNDYDMSEIFDDIAKVILLKNRSKFPKDWARVENFYETLDEISIIEKYLAKIITIIYALYEKHLEANDLIDFDNMINKTIWVLEKNDSIRKYYQNQFKHIIVDEFQDTSTAQMKLLMLLLNTENPNITVVGDKKQSIYAFRYANVENLNSIQKNIEKIYGKEYEEISLDTNYRSIPEILNIANILTKKELHYPNELLKPKKENSNKEMPVKISHISGFDNVLDHKKQEAKYIASEILKYKNRDKLDFKDFAILVKDHNIAEIFEEQLSKYGIPSIKRVNKSYFYKPIIKNILALLKFIFDTKNEKAFIRIMKMNFSDKNIYILKQEIEKQLPENSKVKLGNFCEKLYYLIEEKLFDNLNINLNLKNEIFKLLNIASYIENNKKSLSVLAIYEKLAAEISLYNNYSEIEKKLANRDLTIFEKIIIDFQKNKKSISLKNYLEYIEKAKEDKFFELPNIYTDEINAVQILTIHASKGLEYPYVFVSSITAKASPNTNCINLEIDDEHNFGLMVSKYNEKDSPKKTIYNKIYKNIKEKKERIREYYVAITRAQNYLNIINFDKYSNISPANYVEELEKELPNIVEKTDVNNIILKEKPIIISNKIANEKVTKANNINIEKKENNKMSFSKLHTFMECQYKYLLQYIYNYPQDNDTKNKGLEIGSIFHNLIYNTYINEKFFENSDIQEFFKDAKDLEINKILKMYEHFKNSEYAKFKTKDVLPEYSFEFTYQNATFEGNIDLVWKNENGGFDIVDFKTNKDIKKSLPEYCKQMYLYKKAMGGQGYRVNNLFILHFKKDGIDEYKLSESDIKTAEKELNNDIEEILSFKNEYARKNTKANCFTCGYKYICEMDKSFYNNAS